MEDCLSAIVLWWSTAKHRFESAVPIDNELLHLGIGFLIYWMFAKAIPGRRAPLFAWVAVLLAELANETVDLLVERWPNLLEQWGQGFQDLFWTLALPTVALLLTREPQRCSAG